MEKNIAKSFNQKVEELFGNATERKKLYVILQEYQRNHNVKWLVRELRALLCEPRLLPIYDGLRPLIPVSQQLEYDSLIPRCHGDRLRTVTVTRSAGKQHRLGIAIRGGYEHGVGIYVSQLSHDTLAETLTPSKGLFIGDEIVSANGFPLALATATECHSFLGSQEELELRVRYIGMLPVRESENSPVTWRYVDDNENNVPNNQKTSPHGNQEMTYRDVQLSMNLPVGASLGCSISSHHGDSGIYIQSVRVGGFAQAAGIEVGDQLLRVNDTDFHNITHSQAVVALKGSRMLDLTIRKTLAR